MKNRKSGKEVTQFQNKGKMYPDVTRLIEALYWFVLLTLVYSVSWSSMVCATKLMKRTKHMMFENKLNETKLK
jgi:hypothetical protein